MKKTTIYVLSGYTGQYSDFTEWLICAYTTKRKAETHRIKAAEKAAELLQEYIESPWTLPSGSNPYDVNMQMDYTGTEYHVTPVTLTD